MYLELLIYIIYIQTFVTIVEYIYIVYGVQYWKSAWYHGVELIIYLFRIKISDKICTEL